MIFLFNSKKAQFFIFTAIILIAYSTLLLQSESATPDPSRTFRMVFENFVFERTSAMNNALFEGKDVNTEYEKFLDSFISYSKMKKVDLEIFSVLETGERVYFSNKMKIPVAILNINETIAPGVNTYFTRLNLSEAVLEVRDDVFHENIYKFNISNQGTDSKAVLRVRKGSRREIFVKE